MTSNIRSRQTLNGGRVVIFSASETFLEDSAGEKKCGYFTKPKNGYFICVIFEKVTGRCGETKKFKDKEMIRSAFGSWFNVHDGAMIHTTMDGPESDERGEQQADFCDQSARAKFAKPSGENYFSLAYSTYAAMTASLSVAHLSLGAKYCLASVFDRNSRVRVWSY